jgi:uncharacterized protein (DUF2267 family)
MEYDSFISVVQSMASMGRQESERVACVTLRVLERRLSRGEAADIAQLLPPELRSCMTPERDRETFHLDGFLRRVSEESGLDRPTAEKAARAVVAALRRAVGHKEFHDLRSELPEDLQRFLDQAEAATPPGEEDDPPFAGTLPYEQFLDRVAAETGLDQDKARWATEAVLEALGVRITAGEADDLMPYLPPELRPALTRGLVEGGPGAVALPLEAFVERIAERERVTPEEATAHARAVFSVLREAVGDKEFEDTLAQLPDPYRILLRQGTRR